MSLPALAFTSEVLALRMHTSRGRAIQFHSRRAIGGACRTFKD